MEQDAPRIPEQVRRHSVRGQVLGALRAALVEGGLAPGAVYSAPVLAERFGVSATPVREAMQQLAAEGAVEVVPNRGYRVAVHSPAERAGLAEVRALIEVPVLLRLALTVPAAHWGALRPAAADAAVTAAAGDRAGYAEQDVAFHSALLAAAGNPQLLEVARALHRRSQWPAEAGGRASPTELVADAAEHTALLDALQTGDLRAVEALARRHVRAPGDEQPTGGPGIRTPDPAPGGP